jgi:hypothetical protein
MLGVEDTGHLKTKLYRRNAASRSSWNPIGAGL